MDFNKNLKPLMNNQLSIIISHIVLVKKLMAVAAVMQEM
jgi:hypothetical protein